MIDRAPGPDPADARSEAGTGLAWRELARPPAPEALIGRILATVPHLPQERGPALGDVGHFTGISRTAGLIRTAAVLPLLGLLIASAVILLRLAAPPSLDRSATLAQADIRQAGPRDPVAPPLQNPGALSRLLPDRGASRIGIQVRDRASPPLPGASVARPPDPAATGQPQFSPGMEATPDPAERPAETRLADDSDPPEPAIPADPHADAPASQPAGAPEGAPLQMGWRAQPAEGR